MLVYFCRDIVRIVTAWSRGFYRPELRGDFDYRFGWFVISGTLPIGVARLPAPGPDLRPLRNLWLVAAVALIVWSAVMVFADAARTQAQLEKQITLRDALISGLAQCLALIPGVSRVRRDDQRRAAARLPARRPPGSRSCSPSRPCSAPGIFELPTP